jgi:death-on-curing protein
MAFIYFDTQHAIDIHDQIIIESGGLHGIINRGLIESVIEHVKNEGYYPELEHKLTHLFFSVNKNHAFQDGNKRSAIVLSAYFLEINNYSFKIQRFITEMENVAVDVADNRIDRDLLFDIITSLLYEEDYSEELKLKIIYALGLGNAD